ncbi:helix-turn-helix domain-containing protein [Megasphaera sp.]|uniref:helix-turn-helix domain-containing protein n=1 Tax=Megasphaera sp. TaxID=2023260 RepID=UPI0035210103
MAYNIAEIRKSKKMTQKELAKKSGVSRATISKIENGKTVEVKLSTIEAISNALDINWIELIS